MQKKPLCQLLVWISTLSRTLISSHLYRQAINPSRCCPNVVQVCCNVCDYCVVLHPVWSLRQLLAFLFPPAIVNCGLCEINDVHTEWFNSSKNKQIRSFLCNNVCSEPFFAYNYKSKMLPAKKKSWKTTLLSRRGAIVRVVVNTHCTKYRLQAEITWLKRLQKGLLHQAFTVISLVLTHKNYM